MPTKRPDGTAPRRVIILGASNVTLGFRHVLTTAVQSCGLPLELFVAAGHGRSYGLTTCVLGRTLPAIRACGLWEEWERRPALPTVGLLTDVGNDLLYGVPPPRIVQWVEACVARLRGSCERLVLTGLPLERARRFGPRQFALFRRLMFPSSSMTWQATLQGAETLHQSLERLARQWELEWSEPLREWYGWDPIHVRRSYRQQAWQKYTQAWTMNARPHDIVRLPWGLSWTCRPQRRWILGQLQESSQPCWAHPQGLSVSLY